MKKKKFYMVTVVIEPNSIMYAVIIIGMINSIVQILRKE